MNAEEITIKWLQQTFYSNNPKKNTIEKIQELIDVGWTEDQILKLPCDIFCIWSSIAPMVKPGITFVSYCSTFIKNEKA